MRALPLVLLAALLFPAIAVGGSSIDSAPFERSIRQDLTRSTGVEATGVTCPDRIEVSDGRRFTCQATFASDDRSPVAVRLRGHSGRYRATLRNLLVRHLEDELAKALKERDDITATFTCPAAVRVSRGDRFTCTAPGQDGEITARITQQGGGRVRYQLF